MTTENKIIALLPLKANSERVPGKNFKMLGDKPLVRWMLDTLLSVPQIDQVIINTDAVDQLGSLGITSGNRLLVREREESLCGDFVSMNAVIADDLEASDGETYLMTHCTNPFISKNTLETALGKYLARGVVHDSLFTVNEWQTRFYRKDGAAINHDPGHLLRTQDLEPWYEENSCLYLFSKESFAATGARIGSHPMLHVSPKLESVDIDGMEDWHLAEALIGSRLFS